MVWQQPAAHLNDDAVTSVLLLKTAREEVHEGLQTWFGLTHVHADGQVNKRHGESYLCCRVDGQQGDGVHAAGGGDVQDHPFGPGKSNTFSSHHFLPQSEKQLLMFGRPQDSSRNLK